MRKTTFPPTEKKNDYIRTYIHTVRTYNNNNNNNNSERRKHITTTFLPSIWREFRKTVRYQEDYDVHPNHVLEAFMLDYIHEHSFNKNQPRITQFFIKAEQVNVAEKQVVVPEPDPIDYSKLSLEELQSLFDKAKKLNRLGQMQAAAFELKQRGILV